MRQPSLVSETWKLLAVPQPGDRRTSVYLEAVRLLRASGFATLPEFTLATGRRADVIGLNDAGQIWIVEIKSSIEDYRCDAMNHATSILIDTCHVQNLHPPCVGVLEGKPGDDECDECNRQHHVLEHHAGGESLHGRLFLVGTMLFYDKPAHNDEIVREHPADYQDYCHDVDVTDPGIETVELRLRRVVRVAGGKRLGRFRVTLLACRRQIPLADRRGRVAGAR